MKFTTWLSGLKRGDPRAIEQIWREYFDKLMRLNRSRLGSLPLFFVGHPHIARSALNSFYQGAAAGRFPRLDDSGDL
jgi:hypothetical protein